MNKSKIYLDSRGNKLLQSRVYSKSELQDIIEGQFYYFWYQVNISSELSSCNYIDLPEKQLRLLKKVIQNFEKKNIHIFKNEVKLFQITILHLLLNTTRKESQKVRKI